MTRGLLDGFDDPKAIGLLSLAGPLLQAGGYSQTPTSLGQAIGAGLTAAGPAMLNANSAQARNRLLQSQASEAERQNAERAAMAARMSSMFLTPPGAPTVANAQQPPPIAQFGLTPQQIDFMKILPAEQGMAILAQQQFAKPQAPIKLGANEELRDPTDPSRVLARGAQPDRTFKVGDTRVIEMGDRKVTQEWDGQKWSRLADAPRSTEPRTRIREVTLEDGVYLVNDDTKEKTYIGPRPNRNEGEGREFTQEGKIRGEYTTASKPFEELRQHWTRLNAAHNQKDGPGDIALVYSFMKMLDPTSVVREGEFATAQNAGGVPDQVMQIYNRALQGERLPDNVRDGFLQQGARQFDGIARNQVEIEQRYRAIAASNMLNPERTVPDLFGRLPRPQMERPFQWNGVQTAPTRTADQPTQRATAPALPAGVPAPPAGFEVVR